MNMQKFPYLAFSFLGTTGSAETNYGHPSTPFSERSLNRSHTIRAS